MLRRIFTIFTITILMSGFLGAEKNNLDRIINDVCRSGGEVQKITVEGHAIIKSNDKIADIVNNMYEKTATMGKVEILESKFDASIKGLNPYIQVKKIPDYSASENQCRYYVSFELSQHEHKENINNIRDTIFKVFSDLNVEPEFSYLLIAKYPKYMTTNQMKQNTNSILRLAGCSNIKGMHERNLISYYAYMPEFEEKIKMDDGYTNINIGMRAIKNKNYTYLFIGSPIISVEY